MNISWNISPGNMKLTKRSIKLDAWDIWAKNGWSGRNRFAFWNKNSSVYWELSTVYKWSTEIEGMYPVNFIYLSRPSYLKQHFPTAQMSSATSLYDMAMHEFHLLSLCYIILNIFFPHWSLSPFATLLSKTLSYPWLACL